MKPGQTVNITRHEIAIGERGEKYVYICSMVESLNVRRNGMYQYKFILFMNSTLINISLEEGVWFYKLFKYLISITLE